ncbi:hypothetical protein VTO73DRAFT_3818 [Trametes versicolor]
MDAAPLGRRFCSKDLDALQGFGTPLPSRTLTLSPAQQQKYQELAGRGQKLHRAFRRHSTSDRALRARSKKPPVRIYLVAWGMSASKNGLARPISAVTLTPAEKTAKEDSWGSRISQPRSEEFAEAKAGYPSFLLSDIMILRIH